MNATKFARKFLATRINAALASNYQKRGGKL